MSKKKGKQACNKPIQGPAYDGIFSRMKDLYPVSKTLCFGLKPIGRTREFIQKNCIIEDGFRLAEDYEIIKGAADRIHKRFIEETLSRFALKVVSEGKGDSLQEYADTFYATGNNKTKDCYKIGDALRKSIANAFDSKTLKKLSGNALLTEFLDAEELSATERESYERLKKYTTYMAPYNEIRMRMYKSESKGLSIPNRIVNDNLPIFLKNRDLYERLPETIIDQIRPQFELVRPYLRWADDVNDLFTVSAAAHLCAQSQIDLYNTVIGGTKEKGKTQVKGLNQLVNEYNQEADKNGVGKLQKFEKLKKQILSERSTLSSKLKPFKSDNEFIESLKHLHDLSKGELRIPTADDLARMPKADHTMVYVPVKELNTYSHACCGMWGEAKRCLRERLAAEMPIKKRETPEGYARRVDKQFNKLTRFSVAEIEDAVARFHDPETPFLSLEQYIEKYAVAPMLKLDADYDAFLQAVGNTEDKEAYETRLKDDKEKITEAIKTWLDDLMAINGSTRPFRAGRKDESEKTDTDPVFNNTFLAPVKAFNDKLQTIYNKTRNHCTKKTYEDSKVQLYFGKPTLMHGWDRDKDSTNMSVLLREGKKKYLGIMAAGCGSIFNKPDVYDDSSSIQRMILKYIPNSSMMLPRVGFTDDGIETYQPSEELVEIYKAHSGKEDSEDDNKITTPYNDRETAMMIDYYKKLLATRPQWAGFRQDYKETGAYGSVKEFCAEVDKIAYRIDWDGVSKEFIDKAVSTGQLYLFEITSQSMSEAHHGIDDNPAVLLNEAFSDRNAADTYIRILGFASLYYRKPSIPAKVTHPKGIPMYNKNPNNPNRTRTLPYDIIKNRRYTRENFSLHLPMVIGPGNTDIKKDGVNRMVQDIIIKNPGLYVVGINRGERNLVSIAVTAPDGRIVEQQNLNVFDGFDYRRKLTETENERTGNRKNWQQVKAITNIKSGYLSRVVGEIVRIIKRYDCVVALESLDLPFMQRRQRFEKNIYQQFERDLIGRLGHMMDKMDPDRTKTSLQLTYALGSMDKRTKGNQNGIVFFVSPTWITMTDPVTGFVNRLDTVYESVEKTQRKLDSYRSFHFLPKENLFVLSFSYDTAAPGKECGDPTRIWDVYTHGIRNERRKNEKTGLPENVTVDLTCEMKMLLEANGIDYSDGEELLPQMKGRSADFYKKFLHLLHLTLKNTRFDANRQEYVLVSCTKDAHGRFFDSGDTPDYLPDDADTNAAWNIARKTHMILENIRTFVPGVTRDEKGKALLEPRLTVSEKEWLDRIQR